MKKIIAILLCAVVMLSLPMADAFAASGYGQINLPADDGTGYPVTTLEGKEYQNNKTATKLIVPENIVSLGDELFSGCSALEQIRLHQKIRVIGKGVFEDTAFYEDKDNWEDGVLYIGDALIKADPDQIGSQYTIREGTRIIAAGAFENCKKLKDITLPKTVQYVGSDAFANTAFLKNRDNMKDGAVYLGHVLVSFDNQHDGAFSVPDGVKTIADGAFKHASLTDIVFSDSVRFVGLDAFFDCQNLKSAEIGKSVETLGRGPFRNCALEVISVDEENQHFSVVDGVLYNSLLSDVVRCPQKLTKVTLPASVKRISAYSFQDCAELESINIPEGCVFIGNAAFFCCSSLKGVSIPESMEYIGNSAFSNCTKFESITVPDNVWYLGAFAFSSCENLKEAKIGEQVDNLRYGLFQYCEKLNEVKLGKKIEKIDSTAFRECKYVDDVSNYQDGMLICSLNYLLNVSKDVENLDVPLGVTLIADGAFEKVSDKGKISKISLPATMRHFNLGAFKDIPKNTAIHYDGTISEFIRITDCDWNFNLYTSEFKTHVWILSILFGVLVVFTGVLLIVNQKKKHNRTKTEDDYED